MSCLMSTGPTHVIPWSLSGGVCLDVLLGLLGSMVRINGLFHLLVNGVYWGEIAHGVIFYPMTMILGERFSQA